LSGSRIQTTSSAGGVMTDKLFGESRSDPVAVSRLVDAMKLGTPVVVGSFQSNSQIASRPQLNFWRNSHQLSILTDGFSERAAWIPMLGGYAYGPHSKLESVFTEIGHVNYEGNGVVSPFQRLNSEWVLPQLAFYGADQIKTTESSVLLNGKKIPLNGDFRLPVNFSHPEIYQKRHLSLFPRLRWAREGQAVQGVSKDDYVVILPDMFTGNTDFKATPFGDMPGGFVHVAILNSLLTDNWLRPVGGGGIAVLVLICLGMFVALVLQTRMAVFVLMLGLCGFMVTGLLLFAWKGLVIPWFVPSVSFAVSGFLVIAEKSRSLESKAKKIDHALQGLVPPSMLRVLLQNPQSLQTEPAEKMVSVMFVDIVGFSVMAETRLPSDVFKELRGVLNEIIAVVHRYGGVVDKTLGDGLMCFFGYKYDGSTDDKNHAELGLECAEEIQREMARICVENMSKNMAMFHLRIGLNSGNVVIGNLGDEDRIDFTLVGHAVNFTKRLEESCESFRVLIGKTTKSLLSNSEELGLNKRYIQMKHHQDLTESFEANPFRNCPELLRAAMSSSRDTLEIFRDETRWDIAPECVVKVFVGDICVGHLLDFSISGISFFAPKYLAKKVQVSLVLDSSDGSLRTYLAQKEMLPIVGEVRWGVPFREGFRHGLLIGNLNKFQKDALCDKLLSFTQKKWVS
jgi:class 3 adenylate cyclase